MNKTPDQIKLGAECYLDPDGCDDRKCNSERCPYAADILPAEITCADRIITDCLAYIRHLEAANAEVLNLCKQLERERDALMHWAKGRCDTCAYNDDCVKHDPDPEGLIVHWYDDCESWEWCGVKEE